MAARQQQRGTGYGIQYEDIVPKSEWKDQPEATILTIDLPGFAKEQIKVTYVHTSKVIRVTGERQVTDRRWSRFNEVFTVPQNCLVDKIHGGFKNNVLTLTMPKETITKTAHHPEASRTVAEKVEKLEAEKRLLEETRRKEREEEAEKKMKKLQEEKEELLKKLQEETKAKEIAEERKLNEEAKAKKMAEERKLKEEVKAKKMAAERKLREEATRLKEKAEARKLEEEAKLKEKAEERKLVEEATLEKKIKESKLVDESGKPEERKLPEVVYTKSGPVSGTKPGLEPGTKSAAMSGAKSAAVSGAKSVTKGVGEVVKSTEEKLGYLVEKEKNMRKGIMEKIRGKEMTSEDKKLMVNVGVAALVIFALGAYVSYTFCSSSSSSSSSSSPPSSSSSTKPE